MTHSAAIAAVIVLTLRGSGDLTRLPDIRSTPVQYVRPTIAPVDATPSASRPPAASDRLARRPNLPVIDVPDFTPRQLPPIDLARPSVTSGQALIGGRSHGLPGTGDLGIPIGGADGVSDASAVDRAPRLVGRAPEPRYPATLRSAGIEGRVLAEFVVDTLGRAELATLRFPQLANPLFGDAVREALARYRFLPGEVAGRKVRTRVAVPFEFRLEK